MCPSALIDAIREVVGSRARRIVAVTHVGLTVGRVNGSSSSRALIAFTKFSNAVRAPLKLVETAEARYLLETDSGSRRTESKEDCQV
jgi:hypothetical protein